jgi:ATP-dependent helicase/nuclease subunit A
MTDKYFQQVIEDFSLNKRQCIAAKELSRDVVVTAGAGSGKTRTLVARYAGLLAKGVKPRRIAAITFTTKAAMQMRSKVRESLAGLEQKASSSEKRENWSDLSAQIDSARIGTIHSLCAEILRIHPAEAELDPRFEVLDEGLAQVLKNQAVEAGLNRLVEEERFIPLFENMAVKALRNLLKELLEKRFEAEDIFKLEIDKRGRIIAALKKRLNHPSIRQTVEYLRGLSYAEIATDCGDKFAECLLDFLEGWASAEQALEKNQPFETAILFNSAISRLDFRLGKRNSEMKALVKEFRNSFDLLLSPLTLRKGSSPPSPETEELFESLLPLLKEAFRLVHREYRERLEKRHSLDFDDLEHGAYQLLMRDDIRAHWQGELDAVMVDEYQDTNQYQRDIVNALAGGRGCLFIVGDMRQSIYRFRRADVTVFREEQERIEGENGLSVELDLTYRQHQPLLETMAAVLEKAIGTEKDPTRSYYVPFTPMQAHSKNLPEGISPPHLEFVVGAGKDAPSARPIAAHALAGRLLELKKEGQFENWDEVTLLFRAATGFPAYEEAFEAAGIPFVTIAGRGFYNRPEIRDLINILRALSNPADNLAFAGLLRSPAFGLSDAALFQLRAEDVCYWQMLQGDLSALSGEDQLRAQRALGILNELLPLVDRVPVAELLKQVVDALDYRAILATADRKIYGKNASAAGGRLWRNVDKLLEDPHTSQAATVRDFLEMLSTLDDAGAREGEASAEADGSVRLMTIHKAKGLEFPIVVLADAGRSTSTHSESVYLSKELGVTFKLDPPPMLYNLAKHLDKDQDECEALRVLYVALTRAQNKLIISHHASFVKNGDKVALDGWAKLLDEACGNPSEEYLTHLDEPFGVNTISGYPLRAYFTKKLPVFDEPPSEVPFIDPVDEEALALYHPLAGFGLVSEQEEADRLSEMRSWRVFGGEETVHGKPLGSLVHKALQRWLFPGDPALVDLLQSECYRLGLVSDDLRGSAVGRATELLERFRRHALWEAVEAARERYFEQPYSVLVNGKTYSYVIDLLYHSEGGWHLIDFKTDPIHNLAGSAFLTSENHEYVRQVRNYQRFAQAQLQQAVKAGLCFLDDRGEVAVVWLQNPMVDRKL